MWFRRKKLEQAKMDVHNEHLEKRIQAIHKDTLSKIDEATQSVKEVNKLLDDPTYKIFLATGGDKRNGR